MEERRTERGRGCDEAGIQSAAVIRSRADRRDKARQQAGRVQVWEQTQVLETCVDKFKRRASIPRIVLHGRLGLSLSSVGHPPQSASLRGTPEPEKRLCFYCDETSRRRWDVWIFCSFSTEFPLKSCSLPLRRLMTNNLKSYLQINKNLWGRSCCYILSSEFIQGVRLTTPPPPRSTETIRETLLSEATVIKIHLKRPYMDDLVLSAQ